MRDQAAYVRVGLLILVGLGLAVGLIWYLGGRQIGQSLRLETYFRESVQGLDVGAPVRYRGVILGRVIDIGLVNAEYPSDKGTLLDPGIYQLVFVRYEVDRTRVGPVSDAAGAVAGGLRARLAAQGITGLNYIELDFVDPERYPAPDVPWTPKAALIPSMPSSLRQVQDSAQQILSQLSTIDFEALTTTLLRLLQDLRQEVTHGSLHAAMQEISGLVRSMKEQLLASDIPGLAADFRQTSTAVRSAVDGEDVQRLLSNAALAADRLARVAAQLGPVATALQATSRRTDSSVADLQRTMAPVLRDLQVTAENLRETTDALRRAPSQTLLGAPPPRTTLPGPRR